MIEIALLIISLACFYGSATNVRSSLFDSDSILAELTQSHKREAEQCASESFVCRSTDYLARTLHFIFFFFFPSFSSLQSIAIQWALPAVRATKKPLVRFGAAQIFRRRASPASPPQRTLFWSSTVRPVCRTTLMLSMPACR